MAVSFANLRDHDRGKQFDFVTKVFEKMSWFGKGLRRIYHAKNVKNDSKSSTTQVETKPT